MSLCNDDGKTTNIYTGGANGNGGFGGWNGDWSSWIILFLIFGLFGGWGGYGNGFGGGRSAGGAMDGYILTSDFANIERKLDGVYQGQCQNGYQAAQLANGIQMQLANEGRGLDNAVCNLGYNTQLGFNTLGSKVDDCCCKTQTAIQGVNYNAAMNTNVLQNAIQANTTQGVMNTNAIQQQIQQCCCDTQKDTMQTRFDAAQYNCATLQAIDKVGDRIIDYLAADKAQTLRDENQALRLAASQAAQNQYLINQLRPCPIPAYQTCNPWAGSGYGGCGTCA